MKPKIVEATKTLSPQRTPGPRVTFPAMSKGADRKWYVDLYDMKKSGSKALQTADKSGQAGALVNPPGFGSKMVEGEGGKDAAPQVDMKKLMQKKAMEVGQAPGKSLFMTAFMLWMSGSGIHIFSIMITASCLWSPLKAFFSVNEAFKAFEKAEGVDLTLPKVSKRENEREREKRDGERERW